MTRPLLHHGTDESRVSARTRQARWTDPRTASWLSPTPVWSWPGGDAIVVVTWSIGGVTTYVVLRVGDDVHVVAEVGLRAAMTAFGLEPGGVDVAAAS